MIFDNDLHINITIMSKLIFQKFKINDLVITQSICS
jgi:hypothetical protein